MSDRQGIDHRTDLLLSEEGDGIRLKYTEGVKQYLVLISINGIMTVKQYREIFSVLLIVSTASPKNEFFSNYM
jgi:hypothetical protein